MSIEQIISPIGLPSCVKKSARFAVPARCQCKQTLDYRPTTGRHLPIRSVATPKMSGPNKRKPQSPLSGDEDGLKRRIIMEDAPALISLDELPESDEGETNGGTELSAILKDDREVKPDPNQSVAEKVDCSLIAWTSLDAHNDLVTTVIKSAESTESRIESLEAKLEESISANERLADKIASLEDKHNRRATLQGHINEENSQKIGTLEIEQGFTNRNVFDCRSEVKERK